MTTKRKLPRREALAKGAGTRQAVSPPGELVPLERGDEANTSAWGETVRAIASARRARELQPAEDPEPVLLLDAAIAALQGVANPSRRHPTDGLASVIMALAGPAPRNGNGSWHLATILAGELISIARDPSKEHLDRLRRMYQLFEDLITAKQRRAAVMRDLNGLVGTAPAGSIQEMEDWARESAVALTFPAAALASRGDNLFAVAVGPAPEARAAEVLSAFVRGGPKWDLLNEFFALYGLEADTPDRTKRKAWSPKRRAGWEHPLATEWRAVRRAARNATPGPK